MSRTSPFHTLFAARGASFRDRGGGEIPVQVSGLEDEYRASREAAALFDRSYRASVRVSGRDHLGFLQNMLTNDVKGLAPGGVRPSLFLTSKGKIITDLLVYRGEDHVRLEMEPERRAPFTEALSRYIVSEDVTFVDRSAERALLRLVGPAAPALLERLTGLPALDLEPDRFRAVPALGDEARLSAAAEAVDPSFDLALPAESALSVLERLLEIGSADGLRLAGERTFETLRIEAGSPLFGVDVDETRLPQEAGLERAISFDKGCYIGQEYVVRLAHRGHLNRRLVGVAIASSTVPAPGGEISDGSRSVGQVTSAAFSPGLGHAIALGYVQRGSFEPGTELRIRSAAGDLPARVAELPFRRRAR